MDVTVSITRRSDTDDAENLEATISEDTYNPDVADDLLRRCVDSVLRLHRELHPVDATGHQ